jgi:hypothetical protein
MHMSLAMAGGVTGIAVLRAKELCRSTAGRIVRAGSTLDHTGR